MPRAPTIPVALATTQQPPSKHVDRKQFYANDRPFGSPIKRKQFYATDKLLASPTNTTTTTRRKPFYRQQIDSPTQRKQFYQQANKQLDFFQQSYTAAEKIVLPMQKQQHKVDTTTTTVADTAVTMQNIAMTFARTAAPPATAQEKSLVWSMLQTTRGIGQFVFQNLPSITTSVVLQAAVFTGVVLATSQVVTWSVLLGTLHYLGSEILPGALKNVLVSAGFQGAAKLTVTGLMRAMQSNQALKRVLEQRLPEGYLNACLQGLGITHRNTKVKDIVQQVLTHSLSIGQSVATGNYTGLLFSAGVQAAFATARGLQQAAHLAKGAITKETAQRVMDLFQEATDAVVGDLFEGATTTTTTTTTEAATEATTFIPPSTQLKFETVSATLPAVDMATSHWRQTATLTSMTTAMFGVAFAATTGDVMDVAAFIHGQSLQITQVALDAAQFALEQEIVRTQLMKLLLNSVGVEAIIGRMTTDMTQGQIQQLTTYLRQKNPKALQLLIGEHIWTKQQLQAMSVDQLRKHFQAFSSKPTPKAKLALIAAIQSEQQQRIQQLQATLVNGLSVGISSATAYTLQAVMADAYAYANTTQIPKAPPVDHAPVPNPVEQQEYLERLQNDIQVQKAGVQLDTQDHSVPDPQVLVNEADQIAQGMLHRAADMEKVNQWQEAERAAAKVTKQAMLEARKVREMAARAEAHARHAAAVRRAHAKLLERIRQAAELEDAALKAATIIVTPLGQAAPIPVDEVLLDPKILEALDITMTPITQWLAKEAAKSTLSFVPGVGWLQEQANTINRVMQAGQAGARLYDIYQTIVAVDQGLDPASVKLAPEVHTFFNQQLPALDTLLFDEALQTEKIHLKSLVLNLLTDKVLYGWDNDRVAQELYSAVMYGQKGIHMDIQQSMGFKLWKYAFDQ